MTAAATWCEAYPLRQESGVLVRAIAPEHFSKVVDIVAVYSAKRPLSRTAEHLLDSISAGEETSNIVRLGDFRMKKTQS